MTLEELRKLIAGDECETVEVKETTGQRRDACETLCAFLNKDGGTVVFGVPQTGTIPARTGTTPARTGIVHGLSGTGWTIIGTAATDNIGELLARLPKLRKDARANVETMLHELISDKKATIPQICARTGMALRAINNALATLRAAKIVRPREVAEKQPIETEKPSSDSKKPSIGDGKLHIRENKLHIESAPAQGESAERTAERAGEIGESAEKKGESAERSGECAGENTERTGEDVERAGKINEWLAAAIPSGIRQDARKNMVSILKEMALDDRITVERLCLRTRLSERGLRKIISSLKALGLLNRIGPDKGGHWKLVGFEP